MTRGFHIDRRAAGRARVANGAILFFNGQAGARACNVIDISDAGARLQIHNLSVLPNTFELTLDNFSTARRCCLVWRDGDILGVAFKDRKFARRMSPVPDAADHEAIPLLRLPRFSGERSRSIIKLDRKHPLRRL